ncbi:MAG: hypothetical protein WC761_04265 [Candidatus Paceibacterota bacterium]|jgi:hypothetical protein
MSKLSPYFPTLNRRIIASKRHGNDVAFLVEAGQAFILTYGQIVLDGSGTRLKILGQKPLTADEAQYALKTIFAEAKAAEPILLEIASKCDSVCFETIDSSTVVSPFFSELEIFLSHQKTRGPNM